MRSIRPRAPAIALRRPLVATLVLAALLAACGGGGMGSPDPRANSPQSLARGTVTGLGSVFVNGIEYDDSAAVVTDDRGRARSASELKLGMHVQLAGRDPKHASGLGMASTIVFASELVGPVESVDAATGTVHILGQEVDLNTNTVWDPALGGFAGLASGELLEVYGLYDGATGRYVASRIDPEEDSAEYKLRGVVANLDTGARTYTVGPATIDYSNVSTVPAGLANGLVATALLQTTQGAKGWVATGLELRNEGVPGQHVTVHVRGLVSVERSPMSFTLDGWPVDASGASFPSGQGAIVAGALVQVDGITSNGALVATTVDLQQPGAPGGTDFQVHGPIDGVHAAEGSFILRGTTVSYRDGATFSGGTAQDLAVGRKVLVKGQLAADGNTVRAVSIAIGQ